jgi:branched-chain amino acid transport system substrate-binding protein
MKIRFSRRPRALVVGAVLAPLVAVLAACGSSSSGATSSPGGSNSANGLTKSTIVLGNVGNYTNAGEFGPQYLQSAHSLQAWATFTNAHGGLNGHPVKVIVKDDGNNPATSLQVVKDLIENQHVVALVGVMTSGTDAAWASYVKSKQIPVIGGQALDANWDTNPYLLSTNVDQLNFLNGEFGAAKAVGKKVGIVTCAELAACKASIPFFQKLAASSGLQYAGTELAASTSVGYTAQCQALKDKGADVLIPELDGPTTRRLVDSCAQQNFTPALVLPSSDIDADALKDDNFNNAIGVSAGPLWFGTSDVTHDWAAAYKQQFPNETLFGYSTLGWQAGVVVGAALKNAPATVTSQTILDGLYAQPAKSTFGGWTPPLTYASGKAATTTACMWYAGVSNHALTAPKGQAPICPS